MRTLLFGTATALALLAGSVGAADDTVVTPTPAYSYGTADGLAALPGASTTTSSQTYTDANGATVVTTTTTTTYAPGTAAYVLPNGLASGSTQSGNETLGSGRSENTASPHDSQMATGSHCPPGTPDCASANR